MINLNQLRNKTLDAIANVATKAKHTPKPNPFKDILDSDMSDKDKLDAMVKQFRANVAAQILVNSGDDNA